MAATEQWQRWGRLSPGEGERERLRGGAILSADGAGSQPDSVWGRLSNSRIHHSDCRPCYWWRHESEHGGRRAVTSAVFSAENPWHLGTINVLLCIFFSVCVHTYSTAHAHYAPCHPAIRFITPDLNGTGHRSLFCLTRGHNWISFVYWAFLNTLPPHFSSNAQIRDLQTHSEEQRSFGGS